MEGIFLRPRRKIDKKDILYPNHPSTENFIFSLTRISIMMTLQKTTKNMLLTTKRKAIIHTMLVAALLLSVPSVTSAGAKPINDGKEKVFKMKTLEVEELRVFNEKDRKKREKLHLRWEQQAAEMELQLSEMRAHSAVSTPESIIRREEVKNNP